jgi:hypothetical protein
MTIEKIRKLNGGLSPLLPKGAVKVLSRQFGHQGHTSVSLILKGKWWDKEVVEAAIDIIEADIKTKQEVIADLKAAF